MDKKKTQNYKFWTKNLFNFDLKMSIFDEFTTSFGKEFHTSTEYGTNVRENCSVDHLPTTKQLSFWLAVCLVLHWVMARAGILLPNGWWFSKVCSVFIFALLLLSNPY